MYVGLKRERLHTSALFPMENHIKIKSVADLFLDTFPFGAHSSAVDALWGKVPLVSVAGDTLASRVAFSVARSVMGDSEEPRTLKGMEDLATQLLQN